MRAGGQRGFTLLEILVAFVVLATAAGILYRTFSVGLTSVDMVGGYSEAIAIAEAKLGALNLEKPIAAGEDSGQTEDRRFDWRVAVEPYVPAGESAEAPGGLIGANQLFKVVVTVSWDQRGSSKRSVELSTLRLMGKSPV